MGENIDRGNVGSEDKETLLSLTKSLDDLLDTTFKLTGLGCALDRLEDLLGELLASEGSSNGSDSVKRYLKLLQC